MIRHLLTCGIGIALLGAMPALSQAPAAPGPPVEAISAQAAGSTPVSYASLTQLNDLLAQLERTSQNTQSDLRALRIDRWKTDSSTKRQSQSNVESVQRNLQAALPEIIAQLRAAPEDMGATFKLYRNLDALYDVLGSVTESAGAFGPRDDFQALANDLNALETTRRAFADRLENLASSKEAEIGRLRSDLKAAQAAQPSAPTTPPKKIVVDNTETPKPAKKKPAAKKTSPSAASTTKPSPSTVQPPPQNQPQPPQ